MPASARTALDLQDVWKLWSWGPSSVSSPLSAALAEVLYTESLAALVIVTVAVRAAALVFFAVFLARWNETT